MNAPPRILDTPERLRLRVEDYMLLASSGAFENYTKTELIDGEIFGMNAQYAGHARVKTRLARLIAARLAEIGSELEAIVKVAVRIGGDSMPEPDIVVTNWRGEGPVPVETVALIVEVSDTTLATDLGRKADLYARAGIAEYWVIDLHGERVLAHELPEDDNYNGQLDMLLGGDLSSATIAGFEIDTSELLA